MNVMTPLGSNLQHEGTRNLRKPTQTLWEAIYRKSVVVWEFLSNYQYNLEIHLRGEDGLKG